jgi:putative heme iron utilization protein
MASSSATHSSSSSQAVSQSGDVNNVFQLIQKHQATAARLPPVEEVRTVINGITRGALATSSQKHGGYPSGSIVDFACDVNGSPILAVSSLAVHTQDLLANPKCSLLVARDPEDRTDLIINLYGDTVPVDDDEIAAVKSAYLEKHPDAFWVDFGDFQFMRIETKAVRYVSGVATALLGSGELTGEEYRAAKVDPIAQFSKPVASHMNRDHGEDTRLIVQHSTSIPVDSAYMLDLDSFGFYVKAGYKGDTFKLRIPFPRRAEDRKDVKTLVVEMLQSAKNSN